jgi:peroxiredoxin
MREGTAFAGAPPTAYRLKGLVLPGGKTASLAEIAHDIRLLVVVMKSAHCQVCLAQLRRLEDLSERLRKLGVTTVGLSHEPPAACFEARKRAKLATALVSDDDSDVLRALALWRGDLDHPLPALVLFDRCGAERGRLVGRRPGQRPEPALFDLLSALERAPERCGPPSA